MITIADIRHIQMVRTRKLIPCCAKEIQISSVIVLHHQNTCVRSHEGTPGIPRNLDDLESIEFANVLGTIVEDIHLTRCAQVCSTGTEDDRAEQHDHGRIDKVVGDPDIERGGDSPEEADREADPLGQIPFLGQPESRPETFNHEVGIDVFEIIDSVGKRSSTLDAARMGVTRSSLVSKKVRTQFSIIPYRPASLRLRLVTSGWLAQTCSIRPRNAQQRRIKFNPHQER